MSICSNYNLRFPRENEKQNTKNCLFTHWPYLTFWLKCAQLDRRLVQWPPELYKIYI